MRILLDSLRYKPQTTFRRFNPYEKKLTIKSVTKEEFEEAKKRK
jgi:hypothetical protein